MRTFAVRARWLYTLTAIVPLVLVWLVGSTGYFVFHDELVAAMVKRQANSQYVYEDRLATMRSELEKVTSRQLLDQDSLGSKLSALTARQSVLETRAAMIASLADVSSGASRETQAHNAHSAPAPTVETPSATAAKNLPQAPATMTGFAPVESRIEFPSLTNSKPHPENFETPALANPAGQSGNLHSSAADVPVGRQLDKIAISLDNVELTQIKSLAMLQVPIQQRTNRLRSAFTNAGLSADKLVIPGKGGAMGGPFIPVKIDAGKSPFDREFANLQESIVSLEKFRRLLPYVPLGRPLPGNADITSSFGVRIDPFFGRPALHPGIDFREAYGAPVHATAGGQVVTAGPTGGYGNMVEIDHGNGLSTRYGHMSAISVSEGQWVEAGGVVGKLGSTGRSTGPHLHYETRINDEAVDPIRFLRAGKGLLAPE